MNSADDRKSSQVPVAPSRIKGATEPALVSMTIPRFLQRAVDQFGSSDAVVFPKQGQRLNYQEFSRRVDDLAAAFLEIGLSKGDRVGIWSPNRLEWILTQFASARIGAILVNINPAYRLSELEYALNKVRCRALVTARSFKSSRYLSMIRALAPEIEHSKPGELNSRRLPSLRIVVAMDTNSDDGVIGFDELCLQGAAVPKSRLSLVDSSLDSHDAINIQFTSGTTGMPKGATLSHHNITNNAIFVTDRIGLRHQDSLALPVPLYHCFGMVMGVLGAVSKGATMVFPSEAFEPVATLEALERERCSALYGVPTMFIAMLSLLKGFPRDLRELRTGIMAGAPCPIELMKQVIGEMHMRQVTICYGMTETSPVSFQSDIDDPIDKRCETVGRIHPHVEVKLVDRGGHVVPRGVPGELCTRGYSVMKGYWGDKEKSSQCIREGWMHTGDLAVLDTDGYCSIVGRVKDMIIRGGENIYPREIEEFLFRHPDIKQVQVFGIPDEVFGEEICAWVIMNDHSELTPESVRSYCQDNIAHFKIPKHICIVDELPMTITGKPQKFVMRERMMEMLKV